MRGNGRPLIGMRVDVDTSVGLARGVPRILDLLDRYGARGTFYVVMGPDTMGVHVKRLRKKDYWKRIWRVNPLRLVKSYGLGPFFYGTLLPSPKVGQGHPEMVRDIAARGHEVGLHSYNHARWADHHELLTEAELRGEFERCIEIYGEILGMRPRTSAAPNWRCNWRILQFEEELGFRYLSDLRGVSAFYPARGEQRLGTLQVPQTLPTTHECLQDGRATKGDVIEFIFDNHVRPDRLNVFTIHDWLEGLSDPELLDQLLKRAGDGGYQVVGLDRSAECEQGNRVFSDITTGAIQGGIGDVSLQESAVDGV